MLNAANEVAVHAFLDGRLGFLGHRRRSSRRRSSACPPRPVRAFESLYEADREARDVAAGLVAGPRLMSWFLAFAGFAALIILHEVGHFAAAKAVGMRVERFMLFFPPILAKVRRGETEYGIGAIPLGGYVKITGMNPHEEHPARAPAPGVLRQPVWKRIVVIAAGPAMNILIAFLLSGRSSWSSGVPSTTLAVDEGRSRRPAAAGVLQPGDRILSVDGRPGDAPGLSRSEVARASALRAAVNRHRCAGRAATAAGRARPRRRAARRPSG